MIVQKCKRHPSRYLLCLAYLPPSFSLEWKCRSPFSYLLFCFFFLAFSRVFALDTSEPQNSKVSRCCFCLFLPMLRNPRTPEFWSVLCAFAFLLRLQNFRTLGSRTPKFRSLLFFVVWKPWNLRIPESLCFVVFSFEFLDSGTLKSRTPLVFHLGTLEPQNPEESFCVGLRILEPRNSELPFVLSRDPGALKSWGRV